MSRPKGIPDTLYSVWRNSDDKLMILDGTVDEVCQLLGITKATLYTKASRSSDTTKYTVIRSSRKEIEREADS